MREGPVDEGGAGCAVEEPGADFRHQGFPGHRQRRLGAGNVRGRLCRLRCNWRDDVELFERRQAFFREPVVALRKVALNPSRQGLVLRTLVENLGQDPDRFRNSLPEGDEVAQANQVTVSGILRSGPVELL